MCIIFEFRDFIIIVPELAYSYHKKRTNKYWAKLELLRLQNHHCHLRRNPRHPESSIYEYLSSASRYWVVACWFHMKYHCAHYSRITTIWAPIKLFPEKAGREISTPFYSHPGSGAQKWMDAVHIHILAICFRNFHRNQYHLLPTNSR